MLVIKWVIKMKYQILVIVMTKTNYALTYLPTNSVKIFSTTVYQHGWIYNKLWQNTVLVMEYK